MKRKKLIQTFIGTYLTILSSCGDEFLRRPVVYTEFEKIRECRLVDSSIVLTGEKDGNWEHEIHGPENVDNYEFIVDIRSGNDEDIIINCDKLEIVYQGE